MRPDRIAGGLGLVQGLHILGVIRLQQTEIVDDAGIDPERHVARLLIGHDTPGGQTVTGDAHTSHEVDS